MFMDLAGTLFATIIAVLTVIFAILAKVVGFPDQIRKNYQRKSTKGLSTIMIVIGVIGYPFGQFMALFKKIGF